LKIRGGGYEHGSADREAELFDGVPEEWKGASQVMVFGAVKALVQTWKPMRIVIDATGVGKDSGAFWIMRLGRKR